MIIGADLDRVQGLVAIFGFTGLWATSFRWIRRAAFEFFLVAHILLSVYVPRLPIASHASR